MTTSVPRTTISILSKICLFFQLHSRTRERSQESYTGDTEPRVTKKKSGVNEAFLPKLSKTSVESGNNVLVASVAANESARGKAMNRAARGTDSRNDKRFEEEFTSPRTTAANKSAGVSSATVFDRRIQGAYAELRASGFVSTPSLKGMVTTRTPSVKAPLFHVFLLSIFEFDDEICGDSDDNNDGTSETSELKHFYENRESDETY